MMSGNSVVVPSDLLVYKQLKMRGFWMADWYKNHSKEEASEMHTKLVRQTFYCLISVWLN